MTQLKGLAITAAALFAAFPTRADFLINDDLIVDGSECVGFDCVNGEVFGFDTIRLKENNLRIKFEDTSSTASFPTNDWQIRINDSANGGSSYFAVEDVTGNRTPMRVDAGAPNDSLRVDSSGDLGIRTANPVLDVHARSGDTPGLRLEQDGSVGWQPQTWDVSGNETNFFVRDVTNGSSLPFRIRPGAPSSSLDIANDGDIGMGVANPQTRVHVVGGDGTLRLSDTDATNTEKSGYIVGTHYDSSLSEILGMRVYARSTINEVRIGGGSAEYNAAQLLRFYTTTNNNTVQGTERMRIDNAGNLMIATTTLNTGNVVEVGTDATNGNGASLTAGGVWTNGSSRRNKINIRSLETRAAMDAVEHMHPVTYNGKQDSAETYVGFIAEEIPDLVAMNNRKGIAAIEVAAVLTKVVQEHQKLINEQQALITALEARLAALETETRNGAAGTGDAQ